MARPRPNVLVVDDDAATRDGLTALLESWGYNALAAPNGQAALQRCNQDLPHAIVSDLIMPGMTGLQFIEALHERVHQVAIIMLTGQATIETAVQAMKLGAYDYLPKPLEPAKLRTVLEKGLKQIGFAREANILRQKLVSPLGSYGELIGKSPTMRQVYQRLSHIAPTNAPLLVSGESGTGKKLVARTLHDLSPRHEGAFLALNCAAMAPTLMERELSGYEKGAFPNALGRHSGCFEQADGGTLFLDEITEMAGEVQEKLLRVLEEGQVRRVGGTASIPVAVRVVAATSRLPTNAVKEGKLRQDLFYRLKSFHLVLPPLRERGDDIPLLARYYLELFGEKYQRPIMPWAPDFPAALLAHSWPGNVRELRDVMEQLALLAPGPSLIAADFQQCCVNAVREDNPGSDHQIALRF
ncbi:MAG TPA: sigma-54 dependent transcriptional regulator [Candidatus Binatia bacterium]|jgi:DNA-binding NtrC family response regulator